MPHLQAIVIVLLKVILTNISSMINQANGQGGHGAGLVEKLSEPDHQLTIFQHDQWLPVWRDTRGFLERC